MRRKSDSGIPEARLELQISRYLYDFLDAYDDLESAKRDVLNRVVIADAKLRNVKDMWMREEKNDSDGFRFTTSVELMRDFDDDMGSAEVKNLEDLKNENSK